MMFFHSFGGGVEMKGGGAAPAVVDGHDDNLQQRKAGAFLAAKQQLQQYHHQAQQQQQKPECYSDEVDSRSGDGAAANSEQRRLKKPRKSSSKATSGGGGDDGGSVELAKRPRGRPPGSKNKPKPPVVITRDANDPTSPAAMRPHVLEIAAGQDVVDALSRFSRLRNLGLCVLAGTGLVSNVVLRHASAASSSPTGFATLPFPGHFEILSISATFFPPGFAPSQTSALAAGSGGVSISLAGPHGQVFGGQVAGPLTAAGTVTIMAATFSNPTYHRLPAEDEVSVSVSVSVSGGCGGDVEAPHAHAPQTAQRHKRQQHSASPHHNQQHLQHHNHHHHHHHHHHQQQQQQQRSTSPPSSSSAPADSQLHHLHHHAAASAAAAETCGMSIYSCHLPSDVIWAPAGRSPPY